MTTDPVETAAANERDRQTAEQPIADRVMAEIRVNPEAAKRLETMRPIQDWVAAELVLTRERGDKPLAERAEERELREYGEAVDAIICLDDPVLAAVDRRQLSRALAKLGETIAQFRRIDRKVPSPAAVRDGLAELVAAAALIRETKLSNFIDGAAIGEKPNWQVIAEQMALLERLGGGATAGLPDGRRAAKKIEPLRSGEARAGIDSRTACCVAVQEAHALYWPEKLRSSAAGPKRGYFVMANDERSQAACSALFEAATGECLGAEDAIGEAWNRWLRAAGKGGEAVDAFRGHVRMVLRMQVPL
jgi:hypothetical protein